jgi:4-hydroxy-3-polyprenylbenzoate decarboxylase
MGKLKMLPKLAEVGSFFPRVVETGPCKEVIDRESFSLRDLPVLHCWPLDGGPFITLPMVFSKNPMTGKRNCGMYRMQVYDERTTGMHWQTHKQGAEHHRRLIEQGRKRMDVAVAIGCDPATMYSAISAASTGLGRDDDVRIPPREASGDGEVRDLGRRSSRACRDRVGRISGTR